jgi:hypothetical protein
VWGVLISFEKAGKQKQQQQQQQVGRLSATAVMDGSDDEDDFGSRGSTGPRFVIDVLLTVDPATLPRGGDAGGTAGSSSRGVLPRLLPLGAAGGVAVVVSLPLDHLAALSMVRLKVLKDLRSAAARSAAVTSAAEVLARYTAGTAGGSKPGSSGSSSGPLPLLDPEQDLKVGSSSSSSSGLCL